MGAQAAALLDAGGPVGDVPAPAPVAGSLQLVAPQPYDLARVALGHSGVGLAPTAWDGQRLHRVLDGAGPVVVHPDLTVTWSAAGVEEHDVRRELTTVLGLDDDLEPLWEACDRVPALRWVRPAGAGRLLRSPTAWEDLVGALAATNASYAATQRMVRVLAGDGPFPAPEQVLARDLSAWGYRAPSLRALAERVAGGLDVERWRDLALPDEQVLAEVRALPGFGPFASAQVLPLLGPRPRPVVADAWLDRVGGPVAAYAAMGPWAGSGRWLAVTAGRGAQQKGPRTDSSWT